ncbi:MAG: fasciclin domain-containing protein [Bacteroidaceae bacterium]|nr:fasciclin domain-containing protein [Bacteroidaceae bacterium]
MKRLLLTLMASFLLLTACKENVDDSARYVFKHDTILSYLKKHEDYSQYAALLAEVNVSPMSQSTVAQLLAARGHYTIFAPTNEAIDAYLLTLCEENPDLMSGPHWEDFFVERKRDSIQRVIVLNSIIDSGDNQNCYAIEDFPLTDRAEIPLANMMENKLAVHGYILENPDSLYINGDCPISITQRNIMCLNGVIHQMEKVIAPKNITAAFFIRKMLDDGKGNFLVMSKAIEACGLLDTLSKIRDEVYESLYQRGLVHDLVGMTNAGFAEGNTAYVPRHRYYGFTIFAEPDDFWRQQGLDPYEPASVLLPKLMRWILDNKQYSEEYDNFTTGEDYTSGQNLLYQWTTYHILPMRIPVDRLVFHNNEYGYNRDQPGLGYTIPVCEYYSTMGKRRLLKIFESKESEGVFLNRFPNIDNGRHGTGHEISCDPDKVGCRVGTDSPDAVLNDIVNCCIYPIDAPLALTDATRNNLGSQRLRFDGMSLFPEAMNNEIRLKKATDERYVHVHIPNTVTSYNYFRDMQMNEDTKFVYYNTGWTENWPNLNTDEMKAVGRFEIMLTMLPVARSGIYELRYEVLMTGKRGILQIYFGKNPENLPVTGIPIDLTKSFAFGRYSWEEDTEDEDYNAEIEKRMRNNGVMKGALGIGMKSSTTDTQRRNSSFENLRHIVWRGYMEADQTYYMKLKSVLDSDQREFYMDMLELCPKEVYDNPEKPEDIW